MRSFYYAAAAILLAVSLASAQSSDSQPTAIQSTALSASEPVAPSVAISEMQARLEVLEQKLQQLEERVNAVLPGGPTPAPVDLSERVDTLDQRDAWC